MVKKVDTYKFGPFTFSERYDGTGFGEVLTDIVRLNETVSGLPVLPRYASRLEEEVMSQSIFGTAAIEGNPLTEEEVKEVLKKDEEHRETQPEQEIENLKTAYKIMQRIEQPNSRTTSKTPLLSEKLIKDIHRTITKDLDYKDNKPGSYRNHEVKVGDNEHGGIYKPPKIIADIKTLMGNFIEWINSEELLRLEPIFRGALAHYHLCLIHPFGDGNGRTARLTEAIVLTYSRMRYAPSMLSNFYNRHKDDYFWAFSKTIKSKGDDRTPFLKFVLGALHDSLEIIKTRVDYLIRMLVIKDYVDIMRQEKVITQRQYDLLNILVDNNVPLTLLGLFNEGHFKVIYREVSERTARRDLAKLTKLNLLLHEEDKYKLNVHVLG